jgi:hypothetical protein
LLSKRFFAGKPSGFRFFLHFLRAKALQNPDLMVSSAPSAVAYFAPFFHETFDITKT